MFTTLRETFWILALALILCYGFFVLVGAFSPGEVIPITLMVVGLAGAWMVHALLAGRGGGSERDLESIRARERRGF